MTALILAVKNGNNELVDELIGKGANFNIRDYTGGTPFMIASAYNYYSIARTLMENGADIYATREKDNMTALKFATQYEHNNIERLIRSKGDIKEEVIDMFVDIKDIFLEKLTLKKSNQEGHADAKLLLAAELGNYNEVKRAIKDGANINVTYNNTLTTPLIEAVMNNHLQIVKYLLNNGADIEKKDKKGSRAYDYALKLKYEKIKKLLKKNY